MWRSYLAAFLLAAVVLGGFAAQRYAVGAAEEVAGLVPSSLQSGQTGPALERAYLLYHKKTPLLSTLYVHSLLEEIDQAFEDCFACLALEEAEDYWRSARRLVYLLRRLPEADGLTVENIL